MIYGDWIGRWARAFPDDEALVDVITGRRYTYADLAAQINRMASYLLSLGLQKGERVAVLSFNRAEYLILFLALSRLGGVMVPLNTRQAPAELTYNLKDSEPKALFYDAEHSAPVGELAAAFNLEHLPCFDDNQGGPGARADWQSWAADEPPPAEIAANDPQLIIYTSGTTGVPKGVVLTHGMISANAVNTVVGWDMRASDRTVLHAAMFYTAGWNVFTMPIFMGRGCNVLVKGFEAELMIELIQKERLTVFFGVPTMFAMMAECPSFATADFSSLRFVVSGGAPLPDEVRREYMERKGLRIWEGYGLTEVGPNNFMANGKPGTLGTPMPFVDIKLVDENGREVAVGEEGEILLAGPGVCAGYWNKPQATAEAIVEGWFHTGDMGRVDDQGHYAIAGRKKDMLISGGINIYPAEIEKAIEEHPAVAAAAVIGVPDPKWGEVGKAVVQLRAGDSLSLKQLCDFLAGRLGKFKLPKYLVTIDELPRTAASEKVQKFILKQNHGNPDNK